MPRPARRRARGAPIVRGFGDAGPPNGHLGPGRKHRNANEACVRTPLDVTGCAAEGRPRADSKGP
eukprot:3737558-Alexandrium_andersonii.AAC.1